MEIGGRLEMISEKVAKLLDEQVGKEIASAYLYLSMASYLDAEDLLGFAHWMKVQAKEELGHAMKIYHYLYERGAKVNLPAIEQPKTQWSSVQEVFEHTYEHERKVTESIHNIYTAAKEANDYGTLEFLGWFVKEQVEEEANAEQILRKIRKLKGSPMGLYMLDKELGSRAE